MRLTIIGPGRAGRAFEAAVTSVGWTVTDVFGRGDDVRSAAQDADLVLIATPDSAVADVATAIEPNPAAVVAHVAGALTLDVLGDHERHGSIHPLASIQPGRAGAATLLDSCWFAVAGEPLVKKLADDLGGRTFEVADENRARYHATAAVASNHLVALLGQVERLAASVGVPFDAFLEMSAGSLGAVSDTSPAEALTGPAARGDAATLASHIEALPVTERAAYVALMREAQRLAGKGN